MGPGSCKDGAGKEKGKTAVEPKVGNIFKNVLDGAEYTVKRVVNRMVLLESHDGRKEIVTDVSSLKIKAFYQKKEIAGLVGPAGHGRGKLFEK